MAARQAVQKQHACPGGSGRTHTSQVAGKTQSITTRSQDGMSLPGRSAQMGAVDGLTQAGADGRVAAEG